MAKSVPKITGPEPFSNHLLMLPLDLHTKQNFQWTESLTIEKPSSTSLYHDRHMQQVEASVTMQGTSPYSVSFCITSILVIICETRNQANPWETQDSIATYSVPITIAQGVFAIACHTLKFNLEAKL